MEKVPVIFKKENDSILAAFPSQVGSNSPYTCAVYAHVGQHSIADVGYVANLKRAMPDEYNDLFQEIKNIYHDEDCLVVVNRFTKKHLAAREKQVFP
jgi:hypothetical protein